jgi:DNA polymerase-3 subunit alpha
MDFADDRRDEVIEYTRQRYGRDHVAQIITFGTMAARNAIRDVGRALGISYGECDHVAKLIPSGPGGMTLSEAIEQVAELKEMYQSNERITQLIDIARRLEGVARHTSVHAAGVVITKEPLTKYVPIQRAAKDEDAIVTQYEMHAVEDLGLLKMDFLGLSNLNIIQQALRVIKKIHGVVIKLDELPVDDEASYALLARAESTGVFQLESAGMKRYLKELKPTVFEDILSMVALYRPGPMDAIPDFIAAKHGRKKVTYLHPILEETLRNTYGIIVTQDQVLEIARKFAGFSYAEADILRKAVGKKIKALLDEQRDKFINGAVKTNSDKGVTQELAEKVWDFIEPFARYGFNRAHAACYAMIAYQTAYLKAHYPVEFMASLLTSDSNNMDRIAIEIAECREMGIEVRPPSVNESFVEFGVRYYTEGEQGTHRYPAYIVYGLGSIKNVGEHPAQIISEEREASGPFASLESFLQRCAHGLNKKSLESLSMAGALDAFGERAQLVANAEVLSQFCSKIHKEKSSSQLGLFGGGDEESSIKLHLLPEAPADTATCLRWERELLSIYLSAHPITDYLPYLSADRIPLARLSEHPDGDEVEISAVVMTVRTILTKKNDRMAFVGIEDDSGASELIVFPRTWKDAEEICTAGTVISCGGKVSRKDSRDGELTELKILANTISRTEMGSTTGTQQRKSTREVKIHIPDSADKKFMNEVKGVLELHAGEIPVTLVLPTADGDTELTITHRVQPSEALYARLGYLLGTERVIFQ